MTDQDIKAIVEATEEHRPKWGVRIVLTIILAIGGWEIIKLEGIDRAVPVISQKVTDLKERVEDSTTRLEKGLDGVRVDLAKLVSVKTAATSQPVTRADGARRTWRRDLSTGRWRTDRPDEPPR